jgi:DNA-binding GntR family transcriptional regulator
VTVLKPIASRPASLTEIVQGAIREAIISHTLSPGDRVTEGGLAKQLAVSKTPVREALLKLEYIGLIESDGGRGGRIITPSVETIRSAYEVRIGLEVQAVRILAERHDPLGLSEARGHAESCLVAAEADDQTSFRDSDRSFHFAIGVATGNSVLSRLVRDSFDVTWTLGGRDLAATSNAVDSAREHLRAMTAIESGAVAEAEKAMRDHVDRVQALVLAAFEAEKN